MIKIWIKRTWDGQIETVLCASGRLKSSFPLRTSRNAEENEREITTTLI